MIKQPTLGSGVDLKQFFEASVSALGNDPEFDGTENQRSRGSSPLVQRNRTDGKVKQQAVTDAARALAALWKIQNLDKRLRVPRSEPAVAPAGLSFAQQ